MPAKSGIVANLSRSAEIFRFMLLCGSGDSPNCNGLTRPPACFLEHRLAVPVGRPTAMLPDLQLLAVAIYYWDTLSLSPLAGIQDGSS